MGVLWTGRSPERSGVPRST